MFVFIMSAGFTVQLFLLQSALKVDLLILMNFYDSILVHQHLRDEQDFGDISFQMSKLPLADVL